MPPAILENWKKLGPLDLQQVMINSNITISYSEVISEKIDDVSGFSYQGQIDNRMRCDGIGRKRDLYVSQSLDDGLFNFNC